jgi:hypothetical protein
MPTISVKRAIPQPSHDTGPGVPPFSHHGILELAAPFSRRGYKVDMSASERAERRLAFRPVELPAVPGRYPRLTCVLRLEQPHRAKFRLVRSLRAPDGLTATATAEGDDVASLLAAIEDLAPSRQFRTVHGSLLALSFGLAWWTAGAEVRPSGADRLREPRLVRAEAIANGVRLLVEEEDNRRAFAVRIAATDDRRLALTSDFLAVLGWQWSPLRPNAQGAWEGGLSVPRREPRRTRRLEDLLQAATAHLAVTMARSPADFHDDHMAARWRAALQRLSPLLLVAGSIIVFLVLIVILPRSPIYQVLLLDMSIVVIVAVALMDKAYRLEIPPLPRPLTQAGWDGWP